jgi:hypothetical protein
MKVHRIGKASIKEMLRRRAAWLCVFAGLAVAAAVSAAVRQESRAQSPPAQAASSDASAQAAEAQANGPNSHAAEAERKKQIADDSANLLQLAAGLKAEMNKATKDTLSVSVIRKAGEIEQLARKMRSEMRSVAGKN